MVETSMNMFDLVVLIVIGLSALLSFCRGFVREILSLGAWLGASVITLYTFPTATKFIEPQVKSAVIASGLASIGVFFISLVLISILMGILLKFIKPGKEIGVIDNLVGLFFGVARGILILAIAYFVMTLVMVEKDYPDWVRESKSRPYVAKAAKWVAKLVPSYLENSTSKDAKKKLDRESSELNKGRAHNILNQKLEQMEKLDEDMPESSLPSMEDLQQRIREENAANERR